MRAPKTIAALATLAAVGCAAPSGEPRWPSPGDSTTSGVTGTNADPRGISPRDASASAGILELVPRGGASRVGGDAERLERQTVCVGARNWSAGQLGDTILYRYKRSGQRLEVGYFVYWSTERPWGDNVLSYTVVPALFIDLAYSHFLYFLPGVKDAMHGAADIEGVRIELEDRDGALRVVGGIADDGTHQPVKLSRDDLVDSKGRIVLLTDVWSHQLGAHGGGAFADEPARQLRCYDQASLRPMTDDVARAFRLGNEAAPRRAKPAWLSTPRPTGTASR
jgi:hypothetical protein